MMLDATRYASIGELLRDSCIQFKTSTALVEMDRKREKARYSFLEFKRASERLARRMQDLGVGPGSRVAIILTNQSKYSISAYAAFFSGAVVVPIDYKLTAVEREALIAHAKPSLVITEFPLFSATILELVKNVIVTEAPDAANIGNAIRFERDDASDAAPEFFARTRDDVATIVYSSGTGGRPKGCMLTHGTYLSQLTALTSMYPLVEGDRYFSILPTNHAIDFMCGFIGPLSGGAMVVHQRTLRPEFIFDTLKTMRITHMAVVPMLLTAFERGIREKLDALPAFQRTMIDALGNVNEALTRKKPQREVSKFLLGPIHDAFGGHLKLLFCGGAFVERERAEFFYKLGLPVVIGYGLTEACTVATVNDLKPFRADSVGRVVPGVSVRTVNDDAAGIGEVQIKGPTVMKGYLDDEELTRESFTEDGWLKTGDLGYLDAANHLHLVGRKKNMIVTDGGKNIYPEDIESAFADVACDEMAVFAANYIWPKQTMVGEKLIAVVRADAKDDEPSRIEKAVAQLRAKNLKLADYKRVTGYVIWRETFPRTASMKLKREVLAKEIAAKLSDDAVVEL